MVFLKGILPIQRKKIPRDIIAGITLAAISIPEVMGYTKIIGTPVITGLYTLILPVLAFALFGASRYMVVGADSATAAIVASGLAGLAAVGSAAYVGLTSMVAILAGLMILLARVLKLGFLANFLSRTVLIGFLSGVGVQIALDELHGIVGMQKPAGAMLVRMYFLFTHLGESNMACLGIATAVLALILACEFAQPRLPGALIAVVGMIAASRFWDLHRYAVPLVGEVPSGLPHLSLPQESFQQVSGLFSVAFSCAVVILAQGAATARAYALRHNDAFDENNDLLGLGMGNLASALSGSFVINGSPTKTAIVDSAGGRSQLAQITMAIMVVLVLLFLTAPLAYLPTPVLSAVVFLIGIKLVDRRGMADLFSRSRNEFWLALLTAIIVVIAGVMPGIILALVMSLLYHVRISYKPQTAILAPCEDGHWLSIPVAEKPYPQAEPGLLAYWFGADLFYANVNHFTAEIYGIVNASPLRWLVIDAGSITSIDYSAERDIAALRKKLAAAGAELVWVHVRGELAGKLNSFRSFESLRDCVAAYKRLVEK